MSQEIESVRARYSRRLKSDAGLLYDCLRPEVYLAVQEKERKLIRWIKRCGQEPVDKKRVLEIGCGAGDNILQLIRFGFSPARIVANELLAERAAVARDRLPAAVPIFVGDASALEFPDGTFDIVFQSTVFSSLLDPDFQAKLADCIWRWLKPGGGLLWYDFTYNNPKNRDVRGMPLARIRELFPNAAIPYWRVTLAPPISRRVVRIHPILYTILNVLPFLRTHLLCWIRKPAGPGSTR